MAFHYLNIENQFRILLFVYVSIFIRTSTAHIHCNILTMSLIIIENRLKSEFSKKKTTQKQIII